MELFELQLSKDIKLRGFYYENDSKILSIFVHGFGGNFLESEQLFDCIAKAQSSDCLSLSLPGNYPSDGKYENYTVDKFVDTIGQVINKFEDKYDEIVLIGISFGSLLISLTTSMKTFTNVKKLVMLSPVNNIYESANIVWENAKNNNSLKNDFAPLDQYRGISKNFLESAKIYRASEIVKNFLGDVLIIQPDGDLEFARRNCDIYRNNYRKIQYKLIENSQHCFEGEPKKEVALIIKKFIGNKK